MLPYNFLLDTEHDFLTRHKDTLIAQCNGSSVLTLWSRHSRAIGLLGFINKMFWFALVLSACLVFPMLVLIALLLPFEWGGGRLFVLFPLAMALTVAWLVVRRQAWVLYKQQASRAGMQRLEMDMVKRELVVTHSDARAPDRIHVARLAFDQVRVVLRRHVPEPDSDSSESSSVYLEVRRGVSPKLGWASFHGGFYVYGSERDEEALEVLHALARRTGMEAVVP